MSETNVETPLLEEQSTSSNEEQKVKWEEVNSNDSSDDNDNESIDEADFHMIIEDSYGRGGSINGPISSDNRQAFDHLTENFCFLYFLLANNLFYLFLHLVSQIKN